MRLGGSSLAGERVVVLLYELESLDVYHKCQLLADLVGDFLQEPFGNEHSLAIGMGKDVGHLTLGRVGEDRNSHPAERHTREHRDSPVRHVVGEYRHLVSGADSKAVETVG